MSEPERAAAARRANRPLVLRFDEIDAGMLALVGHRSPGHGRRLRGEGDVGLRLCSVAHRVHALLPGSGLVIEGSGAGTQNDP